MREKLYTIARVLSIIFVADGLFMAWVVGYGGSAGLTYAKFGFPVFVLAVLVGLVISVIYVHGFARQSWTVRKAESLFFLLFFLALAGKVALFVEGQRADQRVAPWGSNW